MVALRSAAGPGLEEKLTATLILIPTDTIHKSTMCESFTPDSIILIPSLELLMKEPLPWRLKRVWN